MTPFPTPTPLSLTGEEVSGVIDAINSTANTFQDFTIGLAALFVFAIFGFALIAYFYFNRNASKGAQELMATFANAMGSTLKERDDRINTLEDEQVKRDEKYIESFSAFSDAVNRIADVVTHYQRGEIDHDRVLSDATSVMTAIATVGSKPLQQVVKDVGEIAADIEGLAQPTADIHRMVSAIYDRFLKVFPTDQTMVDQVRELLIDAVNQACDEKKHETGEIAAVLPTQIDVTLHTVTDEGEVAA